MILKEREQLYTIYDFKITISELGLRPSDCILLVMNKVTNEIKEVEFHYRKRKDRTELIIDGKVTDVNVFCQEWQVFNEEVNTFFDFKMNGIRGFKL